MKKIELLIGDYEYSKIQEIFEKEPDFKPIGETDQIIIKALYSIISPNNLAEEDVGGSETFTTTVKKIIEPENKSLEEGNIEFKDVNFAYEDDERSALSSINLKMDGEKMTALIGLSGAGKSTILNLLSRFYDRNSGDILIDDQSIYKTTLYSLRNNISLVSQDTTLFDDTIKNNIKYAN